MQEALSYYRTQGAPTDQSALISLLREVQRECGGIQPYHLGEIAAFYQIKEGILVALMKRIPSLRLGNQHLLEICCGPNCGKHTASAACAEKFQQAGGNVQVKFVPCMRLCGKGPNVRLDGTVHHGMTEQKLLEMMSALEK